MTVVPPPFETKIILRSSSTVEESSSDIASESSSEGWKSSADEKALQSLSATNEGGSGDDAPESSVEDKAPSTNEEPARIPSAAEEGSDNAASDSPIGMGERLPTDEGDLPGDLILMTTLKAITTRRCVMLKVPRSLLLMILWRTLLLIPLCHHCKVCFMLAEFC